jgi:hypothetical protein
VYLQTKSFELFSTSQRQFDLRGVTNVRIAKSLTAAPSGESAQIEEKAMRKSTKVDCSLESSSCCVTTPRVFTNQQGQRRESGAYMVKNNVGSQPWFVVSKEGLRKTLERKGKTFALYELLQNGFDEDSTKVSLTLTKPMNGKATLICIDDAPNGYRSLASK